MRLKRLVVITPLLLVLTLILCFVSSVQAMPQPGNRMEDFTVTRQERRHSDGTPYVEYSIEGTYIDHLYRRSRIKKVVKQFEDDIGWAWFDHPEDQVHDRAAEKLDRLVRNPSLTATIYFGDGCYIGKRGVVIFKGPNRAIIETSGVEAPVPIYETPVSAYEGFY